MFKRNNQRSNESFIVAKRSQALYTTNGTFINDLIGTTNLSDGQVAFLGATGSNVATYANNKTLGGSVTVANMPALKIIQGTEFTANPSAEQKAPLWTRPIEESSVIRGYSKIYVTKQPYKVGSLSTTIIGQPFASAGKITALSNTTYSVDIRFKGHYIAEFYNHQEALGLTASVVTPDYATLGYSTTQRASHLVETLAYELNLLSNQLQVTASRRKGAYPFIAFAIDSTGVTGLAISGITTSTVIPVVNTPSGFKNIRLNAEQVASLRAAAVTTGLALTSKIVAIDLASAGASGRNVDCILIQSVDTYEAYKDYNTNRKVTATVNLIAGFDGGVYNKRVVSSAEGQGYGKTLDRQYRNTQGQRKYNLIHVSDPMIEFPSPVDTTESYITYVIEHVNAQQQDISGYFESPLKEIILFPTTTKGSETSQDVANANTAFETFLNTWLNSGSNPSIMSL